MWYEMYMNEHRRNAVSPAMGLGDAAVKLSDNNFHVKIDVKQFNPEELIVKTADGKLIVEGLHGAKSTGMRGVGGESFTSRSFCRKFSLPEDYIEAEVSSQIGTDGVLKIDVPREQKGVGVKVHAIRHPGHGVTAMHPKEKGVHFLGTNYTPWHGWPWTHGVTKDDEDDATITGFNKTDKNYVYRLKVPQFSPDELEVKTVDDYLVMQGSHKDKDEGVGVGSIARSFKRQYFLPFDAMKDDLVCEIDKKGMLSVTMPRTPLEKKGEEKVHKVVQKKN